MDNLNLVNEEKNKQPEQDFYMKQENGKMVLDVNPAQYSEDKLAYTSEKTNSQLETEKTRLGTSLEESNLRANQTRYEDKVAMTESYLFTSAHILSRDWRLFRKASPEMQYVRNMVAGLMKYMDQTLPRTQGRLDIQAIKKDSSLHYGFALKACNHYIAKRSPKSIPGKRRLKMVKDIRRLVVDEQRRFNQVLSRLMEVNSTGMEDEVLGDEQETQERSLLSSAKTASDLIKAIRSKRIEGDAVWQKEGNSTDVYRVKLKGKDGKYYYFKENLPPISKDFDGFLKRRLRQLTDSSKNIGDQNKEEARLHGRLNAQDYASGIKILKFIQDKIKSGGGSGTPEEKKYLKFIGQDWAGFFANLEKYNNAVIAGTGDRTKLKLQIESMKKEKQCDKNLLKALEDMYAGTSVATTLTGMQYMEQKMGQMGLDPAEYSDLIKLLKRELGGDAGAQGQKDKVMTFFTRTLGKEAELYGQQKSGNGISDDDIMSTNNTATYRLAEMFGFTDVVTRSQTAVVRMKLKGSDAEEDVEGTLIEEAPGQEMLSIADYARKKNKKLHFSSNAVRQLNRLQLFDTMCNQIDRHWRNFKCETEPELTGDDDQVLESDTIVIKSIKAYDHDMSFGEEKDLDEKHYEKLENGIKETGKNRFLPPILRKLPMNGALYAYFCENISMEENNEIFESILKPVPVVGEPKIHENKCKDFSDYYAQKYYRTISSYAKKKVEGGKEAFGTITAERDKMTVKVRSIASLTGSDNDNEVSLRRYQGVWIDRDGNCYEVKPCDVAYSVKNEQNKEEYHYETEMRAVPVLRDRLEVLGYNDNQMAISALKHTEDIGGSAAEMYGGERNLLGAVACAKFKPGYTDGLNEKQIENIRLDDCQKLANLTDEMRALIVNTDSANPLEMKNLSALSDQDKTQVMAVLIQMRNITDKYNLADNTNAGEIGDRGFADYFYRHLQYMIKTQIYDQTGGKELARQAVKKVEEQKKKEQLEAGDDKDEVGEKKKKPAEIRYAEVPTMLHADGDAYESLLLARDKFDTSCRMVLKDLGWTDKKINALRTRINQEIEKLERAKTLAEKYLSKKYPADSKLRNFFLKPEEFSQVKNLKDLSWDKSMSYFGSEIQNTMVYDPNFTKLLKADEIEKLRNDNKAYYEGEERIRIKGYDGDLVNDAVM